MGKINSRKKGNKTERVVAELLGSWANKKFSRTPSSGGLNWKSSQTKGDIVCTEEGHYFPFCIEVKNYRGINFEHPLYLKKPKIVEFWEQASTDAAKCNKIPLLFMRYNGLPKNLFFVLVPFSFISFLNSITDKIGGFTSAEFKKAYLIKTPELDELILMTTEEFLKIPYKNIRKPLRKWLRKKEKKNK